MILHAHIISQWFCTDFRTLILCTHSCICSVVGTEFFRWKESPGNPPFPTRRSATVYNECKMFDPCNVRWDELVRVEFTWNGLQCVSLDFTSANWPTLRWVEVGWAWVDWSAGLSLTGLAYWVEFISAFGPRMRNCGLGLDKVSLT